MADRINRIFLDYGVRHERGRVTAATVRHGLLHGAGKNSPAEHTKHLTLCSQQFILSVCIVTDANKVTQIIEYEAKSNVPFPLEEVVWDYQILGSAPSGELEVLLVAIKADIVEGLFRVRERQEVMGLEAVDARPAHVIGDP